ncbi:MAG: hypothetical protein HFG73_06980 [Hungatella sp.]|nr:hypothetical protein [Hungatella sp.]
MRKIVWVGIILCFMAGCSPAGRIMDRQREALAAREGEKPEDTLKETAVSIDGSLMMAVPEGWEAYEDPAPYDLRLKSLKGYTGVFVYSYSDFEEETRPEEVLDYQITELMYRRENVSVYQEQEIKDLEYKVITQITYVGEKDSSENIYHFSLVDFEADKKFAVVIQSSLPDDFEDNREELNAIVESAELVKEEPDTV